jgi:hypothetical protein
MSSGSAMWTIQGIGQIQSAESFRYVSRDQHPAVNRGVEESQLPIIHKAGPKQIALVSIVDESAFHYSQTTLHDLTAPFSTLANRPV